MSEQMAQSNSQLDAATRSLGLVSAGCDDGRVEFNMATDPSVPNPNGAVNGGIMAAALETAALHLARQAGGTGTAQTATLHFRFHRPTFTPVRIIATLLPGGRRVQFIRTEAFGADGELCVSGCTTMAQPPAEEA